MRPDTHPDKRPGKQPVEEEVAAVQPAVAQRRLVAQRLVAAVRPRGRRALRRFVYCLRRLWELRNSCKTCFPADMPFHTSDKTWGSPALRNPGDAKESSI